MVWLVTWVTVEQGCPGGLARAISAGGPHPHSEVVEAGHRGPTVPLRPIRLESISPAVRSALGSNSSPGHLSL